MVTNRAPSAQPNTERTSRSAPGALDRYFLISERGSTLGREVRGGFATFFAMSYIVVLNPLIIGTVADADGNLLGHADGVPSAIASSVAVAGTSSACSVNSRATASSSSRFSRRVASCGSNRNWRHLL